MKFSAAVPGFNRFPVWMTLLLALMACTTLQPVDLAGGSEDLSQSIMPGDVVRITTRNGERHLIQVSAVTPSEISGEGKVFTLEEIEGIEVRRETAVDKVANFSMGVAVGVVFWAVVFGLVEFVILSFSGL